MKGMIFTEFIEMIEDEFGLELADRIVTSSNLPSGGAYTAVGTYDHHEMLTMVGKLSEVTGVPAPQLANAFGKYLFSRFTTQYPQFMAVATDSFTMLEHIDGYIHIEVRKLYSDAELPRVMCERDSNGNMILTYRSSRPFASVAEGLIQGCVEHFKENVIVMRMDDESTSNGTHAVFTLTRHAPG